MLLIRVIPIRIDTFHLTPVLMVSILFFRYQKVSLNNEIENRPKMWWWWPFFFLFSTSFFQRYLYTLYTVPIPWFLNFYGIDTFLPILLWYRCFGDSTTHGSYLDIRIIKTGFKNLIKCIMNKRSPDTEIKSSGASQDIS